MRVHLGAFDFRTRPAIGTKGGACPREVRVLICEQPLHRSFAIPKLSIVHSVLLWGCVMMSTGGFFLRFVNGVVGSLLPETWHKSFDRLRLSRFRALVVGFGQVGKIRCFR